MERGGEGWRGVGGARACNQGVARVSSCRLHTVRQHTQPAVGLKVSKRGGQLNPRWHLERPPCLALGRTGRGTAAHVVGQEMIKSSGVGDGALSNPGILHELGGDNLCQQVARPFHHTRCPRAVADCVVQQVDGQRMDDIPDLKLGYLVLL